MSLALKQNANKFLCYTERFFELFNLNNINILKFHFLD